MMRTLLQGLNMDEDGYILVDERMATSLKDVWAAGDIVNFPLLAYDRSIIHIGP
jgi:thioredoxin reductase